MSRQIRNKNQKLHKQLGKIYYIGILFGGLSGLYLGFEATGGVLSTFGFGFLSVFWIGTAGIALYKIKQRQVEQHRKWMIRNYSLTFVAVTLGLVTNFHSTSRRRKLYNQLYHHIVVMLDPKSAHS